MCVNPTEVIFSSLDLVLDIKDVTLEVQCSF